MGQPAGVVSARASRGLREPLAMVQRILCGVHDRTAFGDGRGNSVTPALLPSLVPLALVPTRRCLYCPSRGPPTRLYLPLDSIPPDESWSSLSGNAHNAIRRASLSAEQLYPMLMCGSATLSLHLFPLCLAVPNARTMFSQPCAQQRARYALYVATCPHTYMMVRCHTSPTR